MSASSTQLHFVREPFELAASFYLFHLAGNECTKEYATFCNQLQHESLQAGVLRTAQHLLYAELPNMIREYRALQGKPNALTLRLEDWDNAFSATLDSMLRFLSVNTSSAAGTSLRLKALHADMHGGSVMSPHTTHTNLSRDVEFKIYKTLLMNHQICRALANYTYALGYSHSLQAVMARCP